MNSTTESAAIVTETEQHELALSPRDEEAAVALPACTPDPASQEILNACNSIGTRLEQLGVLIDGHVSPLAGLCQQLLMDVNERAEQARLRETLYEKLDASRPSFQFQLVRPILMRLAAMYDMLQSFRSAADPAEAGNGALSMLESHLRETLAAQGVELVNPQGGDRFDNSLHYVIQAEITGEAHKHETIERAVVPGFVYVGTHDRTREVHAVVLRPARVTTWKYDPSASIVVPAAEKPET